MDDASVRQRARDAANGEKFRRLWHGAIDDYGGDDSAAVLALLASASFYTQDPAQLDRLFRKSGVYREKWEREDYRERTIAKALERDEIYRRPPAQDAVGSRHAGAVTSSDAARRC